MTAMLRMLICVKFSINQAITPTAGSGDPPHASHTMTSSSLVSGARFVEKTLFHEVLVFLLRFVD